jgi:N-methylhydantoinase A/acetophenone carboxylase
LEGPTPNNQALKGEREVYWEDLASFKKTKIYSWDSLKPGNILNGPVIIEANNTTYVISPNWKYTMDKYMNGIMEINK